MSDLNTPPFFFKRNWKPLLLAAFSNGVVDYTPSTYIRKVNWEKFVLLSWLADKKQELERAWLKGQTILCYWNGRMNLCFSTIQTMCVLLCCNTCCNICSLNRYVKVQLKDNWMPPEVLCSRVAPCLRVYTFKIHSVPGAKPQYFGHSRLSSSNILPVLVLKI